MIAKLEKLNKDIHDVMAHDDGKARERAEFIVNAVNNYEMQERLIRKLVSIYIIPDEIEKTDATIHQAIKRLKANLLK